MKPKIKILLIAALSLIIIFGFGVSVFAQTQSAPTNSPCQTTTSDNPGGLVSCRNCCTISSLINTIASLINFLLAWAWLVSLIFVVWAGLRMVFAGGNEETISTGKKTLSNAIIGFIIILVSYVLINFVIGLITGNGITIDSQSLTNALLFKP